jgi:phosphatidylethanolamine/phosphatidyl-N-methylethanolamine N-methyltransferase
MDNFDNSGLSRRALIRKRMSLRTAALALPKNGLLHFLRLGGAAPRIKPGATSRMRPLHLFSCMLRDPSTTGALLPSSSFLAKAMAEASSGAGAIVELGAGTGAITRALLVRHGAPPLIAVEINPELALGLKKRFPKLDVRQARAQDVLAGLQTNKKLVVVSSLPFRSLPAEVSAELQASLVATLKGHADSWLVQFTYQPRKPFEAPVGFRWEHRGMVWRNVPPAGVWVLRRADG